MKKKKALLVWAIVLTVLGIGSLFTVWFVGILLLAVAGLLGFLYFKPQKEVTTVNRNSIRDLEPENKGSLFQKKSIRSGEIKYYGFRRIIAFDTETTGLDPKTDHIIEIGAAVFENQHDPSDSFSTLINPGMHIPEGATKVNHITDEMVALAPTEKDAINAFTSFLQKYTTDELPLILVAHNATFDIAFLEEAFKRAGTEIKGVYVDTLAASRNVVRDLNNYKLGTLAEHFNIKNPAAHRALGDAETVGHLFRHLLSTVLNEK